MNEKKVRKVNTKILVIILSLAIIAAAFTLIAVFSKISTTYKKVYINDICAGGKNVDEVKKLLSEKYVPENTNVIFDICNSKELKLKNGCKVVARSSGPNASRGVGGVNYLIFDESAFIENGAE